eukprot:UN23805
MLSHSTLSEYSQASESKTRVLITSNMKYFTER